MPIARQNFFEQVAAHLKRISRWSVAFALLVSAFGSSTNAIGWEQGGNFGPLDWIEAGLSIFLVFGAVYFVASDIVGRKATWLGYVYFAVGVAALFGPFAMTFAALMLVKLHLTEGWRAIFLMSGILVGFAFISLLPAWPLAQAIQRTLVSPLTVFRATRGHRGGLVGAALTLSVINRADFIPKMQTAHNVGEVVLIAAGQTLMGIVGIIFTASIAATALQFALRNDAALVE